MKKLNLSAQLSFVFAIAFLITSFLVGYFVIHQLDSIYTNTVYERLEAKGKTLNNPNSDDLSEFNDGIAYICYYSTEKTYSTSDNISQFISEQSIRLLVNKAAAQTTSSERYFNLIDSKSIYYIVQNYQGILNLKRADVIIVLTDNQMKNALIRDTAIQIFLACFVAFLIGYSLIFFWVRRLVWDTKKIARSLNSIGLNHYQIQLTTSRTDEIGELVENIERMRHMIIAHEKEKQELIQGVSHDLKTPIAVIQSYAEALEDGVCTPEEVATITAKQCDRLHKRVTKLLHLSRIGYLAQSTTVEEITNVHTIIEELVSIYQHQTTATIELNISVTQFRGDVESWTIAIENLFDNAIRYAKTRIIITLCADKLSIENDGNPIDPSRLPHLFDAYTKGPLGNTGIGLSIVKRTTQLFGYSISVSNTALGVAFTITRQVKQINYS